MRKLIAIVSTILATAGFQLSAAAYYNVKDYGAKGDGTTIDSPAVNAAIEAASEAGGGTVYFPAGTYASYSIRLKDNICLYLDAGAVLKAAKPTAEAAYDLPEPNDSKYQDFGHSHWKNSLIWGIGLHDISIKGPGKIDGTDGITRGQDKMNGFPAANKAVGLKECRNVSINDVSFTMTGHFALLMTGVDNLTIDNVKVDTNRDAFDIDCCANVRISNCTVNTLNDDGIVLKSSYALGYAKATENVTITNCQVSGYDPGSFLDGTYKTTITAAPDRDGPTGRIKLGTESNGGFKNITISNCIFDHCRGLALETVDGGIIEDITVDNISMRDIVNSPIYVRLGNRARGPEGTPHSIIRRVKISNIVVKDADCRYASMIFGLEGHPIEDITLSNIHIQYKGGLTMEHVRKQIGTNPFFARDNSPANGTPMPKGQPRGDGMGPTGEARPSGVDRDPFDVPDMEKGYPEPSAHGILPVYGLLISNARNVTVDKVVFETINEDERPVIFVKNAEDVLFSDIKVDKAAAASYIVLKDVKDLSIRDFKGVKDRKISVAKDMQIEK